MDNVLRLEEGRLVIFRRGGKYHARICTGPNQYLSRSLRTGNREIASKAGLRLYHQFMAKQELGLPLTSKTVNEVLDEYVSFRTRQCQQGNTSAGMLRQIVRNVRFWREYAGPKPIIQLDNAALKDFVTWRRDYYASISKARLPRNAKRHPTDKEIVYNLMVMRAVLKWAHERGYMGSLPIPTYTFTAKKKRVRPAFEVREYRQLLQALLRWERACERDDLLHTRQLLRDYVLILANSGMRVGEANSLRVRDVLPFTDAWGRKNYRFIVRGKTGERDVIPRLSAIKPIERVLSRKANAKPDDWFFAMRDGGKIITLIDQFDKIIRMAGIERNSAGDKYSLYSLRHFYAVMGLRSGIGVFDIARNMGTSIQMIQQYYGRQATPMSMATTLGGSGRRSVA
jgi:integrase